MYEARSPQQAPGKAMDAIYNGPSGSHLGVGRSLLDGTLDRSNSHPDLLNRANTQILPSNMQYGSFLDGAVQTGPQGLQKIAKYSGLKADNVPANGGIGVTYSNVVLGAGGAPNLDTGLSSYKHEFAKGRYSH